MSHRQTILNYTSQASGESHVETVITLSKILIHNQFKFDH